MTDMTSVLHYVHDPLCGWCYAAEPLLRDAVASGAKLVLHGGGLFDVPVHVPAEKRRMIRATDLRIGAMTGQVFGGAYLDRLLVDPATVWWSRPPVAAVLAAEALQAGHGLAMLAAIQRAHYVEGRRVVEDPVLVDAARSIGLDADRFAEVMRAAPLDAHLANTRRLMQDHALRGFPSFLLEREGRLAPLPHEGFYGHPGAFAAAVHAAGGAGAVGLAPVSA